MANCTNKDLAHSEKVFTKQRTKEASLDHKGEGRSFSDGEHDRMKGSLSRVESHLNRQDEMGDYKLRREKVPV